jgi:hypothetical protein
MAKKLPDIAEEERHIAPITDSGDDDKLEADETDQDEILEGDDGEEQEDGSVVFHIDGDKPPVDDKEFLVNLAEVFDENDLQRISTDLIDLISKDRESRRTRDEQYKKGLQRTGLGDDAPGGAGFEGASSVVHPVLAESCIDFESRAIKELFPASGPVKTNVVGKKTEEKLARADRKAMYMNYQMTTQMTEYRPTLEQILTQVPMAGSQYQKFWFDPDLNRPRTCFVPIDDILLPFSTTDFYGAQRMTHVQHITANEMENRVESGMYRDVIDSLSVPNGIAETASAEANNKIEGKDQDAYNDDGLRDVYEIAAWLSFDEDSVTGGEKAPYLITIDEHTDEVLAVYRNWAEGDKKFRKLDWMVEWQFIPWRGAYSIGLPHLIGGLSGAATGALRALLDSAHINNSATLIKLKSGKQSGQNITVEPTEIAEIEGPAGADDIRKVMMAMPYNQPSTVLFSLLGWLTDAAKGVIATAEEAMSNVGDRTPVGTTMAMVEQGSHTYSAIHARLHNSQAKAMQILCRINGQYLDDEVVVEELGELIVSRVDFANSHDIIPVSDPNIFSETQRYAQMQGVGQVVGMFPDLLFDKNAIARRMLSRMRVEDIDEILPPTKKPQNMNPVAENLAAMMGTPLMAMPNQDHMAHIIAHMEFAASPVFGSQIMGTKLLPGMIEHLKQHIGFYYSTTMGTITNFAKRADTVPTKQMEQEIAHTQQQVLSQMNQQLAPVLQGLMQLQQKAEAYNPPPPQDPSIAATVQVAMAELERKKVKDAGELQIKAQTAQFKPQEAELKAQTNVIKNQHSNQQHQETELLKNQGDNETNQWITAMKMGQVQSENDMQARLDQLQTMIDATQNEQKYRVEQESAMLMHKNELGQQGDQHAAEQETALKQTQMQVDAQPEPSQPQE